MEWIECLTDLSYVNIQNQVEVKWFTNIYCLMCLHWQIMLGYAQSAWLEQLYMVLVTTECLSLPECIKVCIQFAKFVWKLKFIDKSVRDCQDPTLTHSEEAIIFILECNLNLYIHLIFHHNKNTQFALELLIHLSTMCYCCFDPYRNVAVSSGNIFFPQHI